jgi:glycosyltransferase involved in cell wall biosynthesis
LKILVFHTYNQGYLSSFFHELSIKLIQEGHEVVSFSWKAGLSERLIDDVKVIVKKKKGYLINYYNVYSIIKREKPDVILSNFSYVNPALLCGKLFGIKKNIAWFHSLNEQMLPTRTQVFIKSKFLTLADTIIANSFLTKKQLEVSYNLSNHKIKVIPFWSNISNQAKQKAAIRYIKDKNSINIGCPGRVLAHKNQKIVIEALSKLSETYKSKFHLFFAGEGEQLSDLKKMAKDLELSEQTTFLNHLSSNEMINFYENMDVIVLPSLHEAFGLVFIEAISLGTPVLVSSQFGALSFLKENEIECSKFTFNPESANDLLDKLLPYFKNEGLSKDFFKHLYRQNFDKDVIFKKILKTIKPSKIRC